DSINQRPGRVALFAPKDSVRNADTPGHVANDATSDRFVAFSVEIVAVGQMAIGVCGASGLTLGVDVNVVASGLFHNNLKHVERHGTSDLRHDSLSLDGSFRL